MLRSDFKCVPDADALVEDVLLAVVVVKRKLLAG